MKGQAIEFDFAERRERPIRLDEVCDALARGCSCWVDLELGDSVEVATVLRSYGFGAAVIDEVLAGTLVGRYDVYDECLHVAIAAPRPGADPLSLEELDLILAERLMISLHRGQPIFLMHVQQNYRKFFQRFAQSLGFLLFEIWDSLIEIHRGALTKTEVAVEQTQHSIFTTADDAIFEDVARIGGDLLNLRKNVVAARDVLDQLASHRSAFVPETTQPYLRNMVGMLNRLAEDLTVERETLAESLTLYLGIVGHRTNRLLHRLTLVSVIFLPLMFLCGVYGMNLALPEYEWKYGYLYFWILVLLTLGIVVLVTRLRKMW